MDRYPRAMLLAAAVLWSTSSVFMRVLSEDVGLGLDEPRLSPLQIAFYRGLFAGVALLPLLRRADIRFRPRMAGMTLCFGLMSGLYLSAMGLGSAANAILLQNTAPFWVYLLAVACLGETGDRRSLQAILIGLLGALVIVAGNWSGDGGGGAGDAGLVLVMALGSGVAYAGVIIYLRLLRADSGVWLTVLNLLGSAAVIGAWVLLSRGAGSFGDWLAAPTGPQLAWIALFGVVQMAAPYLLFARGLRHVGPQEAGVITLLEPVLNPVWAYLIAPERETPTPWTLLGGAILLAALLRRYWPRRAGGSPGA